MYVPIVTYLLFISCLGYRDPLLFMIVSPWSFLDFYNQDWAVETTPGFNQWF